MNYHYEKTASRVWYTPACAYCLMVHITAPDHIVLYCFVSLFRTFQVHISFNIDDRECNKWCNLYGA